jgi:tRNA A64-2'-O-ribosylphosphate transferase
MGSASGKRVNDSAVLVDSTRRGKRMPDALSKTVPIWCAVINLATAVSKGGIEVAGGSVSTQEAERINDLLPGFVKAFNVRWSTYWA